MLKSPIGTSPVNGHHSSSVTTCSVGTGLLNWRVQSAVTPQVHGHNCQKLRDTLVFLQRHPNPSLYVRSAIIPGGNAGVTVYFNPAVLVIKFLRPGSKPFIGLHESPPGAQRPAGRWAFQR